MGSDENNARRAAEWAASPEGQQALTQAMEDAWEFTDALVKARAIDPRKLNESVGPRHFPTWAEELAYLRRQEERLSRAQDAPEL